MKWLIPALLALAVLASCAVLPSSGPLVQVTSAALPNEPRAADIAAAPPLPGASPEQLVAGFLVAMATGQPGLGMARLYLSEQAEASWRPDKEPVQVYDAALDPPIIGANVTLDASLVGEITSGRFHPRNGRLLHDLRLVKEGSEWRISNPPRGRLLSRYMFGRYYKSYPAYFFNARHQLVPELIHLPNSQATPEKLLTHLLEGPSAHLSRAVGSAIPAGTSLKRVNLGDDGVAEIDLDGRLAPLGDEDRRLLGAQLAWTLTSFPRVSGVTILNAGSSYTVPGQSDRGVLDLASLQGYQVLSGSQAPGLFAVVDGRVGQLNDKDAFEPLRGNLGLAGAGIKEAAFSLDGTLVAATDGQKLFFGSAEANALPLSLPMTGLRKPQVVAGKAWVLGQLPSGEPAIARADARVTIMSALDKLPGRVIAMQIAPAGGRVAAILETPRGRRLGTFVLVEKDESVELTDWVDLSPRAGVPLAEFRAVNWASETDLVTLARADTTRVQAYMVSMDGSTVTQLGPIGDHDLVDLSALPRRSGSTLVALTAEGTGLRFDARARWQQLSTKRIQQVLYAG